MVDDHSSLPFTFGPSARVVESVTGKNGGGRGQQADTQRPPPNGSENREIREKNKNRGLTILWRARHRASVKRGVYTITVDSLSTAFSLSIFNDQVLKIKMRKLF